jgi:hypothetical protein
MFVKETEHKSAGKFAWFAARDASLKSAVNASRFSDSQKIKAERMKMALELVYSCEEVKITNCVKWIRVKVIKGIIRDRKNLKALESDWTAEGITKVFTDQGIIYRVA